MSKQNKTIHIKRNDVIVSLGIVASGLRSKGSLHQCLAINSLNDHLKYSIRDNDYRSSEIKNFRLATKKETEYYHKMMRLNPKANPNIKDIVYKSLVGEKVEVSLSKRVMNVNSHVTDIQHKRILYGEWQYMSNIQNGTVIKQSQKRKDLYLVKIDGYDLELVYQHHYIKLRTDEKIEPKQNIIEIGDIVKFKAIPRGFKKHLISIDNKFKVETIDNTNKSIKLLNENPGLSSHYDDITCCFWMKSRFEIISKYNNNNNESENSKRVNESESRRTSSGRFDIQIGGCGNGLSTSNRKRKVRSVEIGKGQRSSGEGLCVRRRTQRTITV